MFLNAALNSNERQCTQVCRSTMIINLWLVTNAIRGWTGGSVFSVWLDTKYITHPGGKLHNKRFTLGFFWSAICRVILNFVDSEKASCDFRLSVSYFILYLHY